jgi:hypothetical protein
MRQRAIGVGWVALLGLGLGACEAGDARESRTGAVGRSTSALQGTDAGGYGGADDTVDAIANVVVTLDDGHHLGCSGTLISPLVVLTANHCLLGDDAHNIGFQGGAFGPIAVVNVLAPRPGLVEG